MSNLWRHRTCHKQKNNLMPTGRNQNLNVTKWISLNRKTLHYNWRFRYANLKRFHYKTRKTKQNKKLIKASTWPSFSGQEVACRRAKFRWNWNKKWTEKKFLNCGTNLRQRWRENDRNRRIQSAQEEIHSKNTEITANK